MNLGLPLLCQTNLRFGYFSQQLCDKDSTIYDLYVTQTLDISNIGRVSADGVVTMKLTAYNIPIYKIFMFSSLAYPFGEISFYQENTSYDSTLIQFDLPTIERDGLRDVGLVFIFH